MRIKNVGKCKIIFNGGSLDAGQVAVFSGSAEKIGVALLIAYPNNLLDLDNIKQEEIVEVVIDEPAEEPKEEIQEAPKAAPKKKSKKN
jgi:hypothetical protein